jgi:sigma-B regulation protein RsbU (phosphoserine phosphatase)
MLFIVSQIITKELKPLRLLDNQAQIIASGQFDQSLSASGRVDEIGRLAHSFGDMQQSLITYMNELKETTAQKERIESELRIASDIQMSMVPHTFPENCGFDLYATMTPAKMVGGDLYNYLVLEDKLYIALGDVSGKGVPASLFMTQATRLFRTLAGEGLSPETIAERMNSGLCEGNEPMMFVTMFIGLVNLSTGQLHYCNCGHNPPTIDGKFIELKYTNRPLGMFEGGEFEGETIDDIRGKQILIYTDGLNEAMNTKSVQFGNERLLKMMVELKDLPSREVIEKVRDAVERHRDGAEPNDDLTMMCLRFEKLCDK